MGLKQVQPLHIWVDLGVMAMKVYATLPRPPELEPHYKNFLALFIHTYLSDVGTSKI